MTWVLDSLANSQAAFRRGKCMTRTQSHAANPCRIPAPSLPHPCSSGSRFGQARLLHGSCNEWTSGPRLPPPACRCAHLASIIAHRPPIHFHCQPTTLPPSPASPFHCLHTHHLFPTLPHAHSPPVALHLLRAPFCRLHPVASPRSCPRCESRLADRPIFAGRHHVTTTP
jgi:hypothetical protein